MLAAVHHPPCPGSQSCLDLTSIDSALLCRVKGVGRGSYNLWL